MIAGIPASAAACIASVIAPGSGADAAIPSHPPLMPASIVEAWRDESFVDPW